VGHTINPGPQAATSIKGTEASPNCNVNLLEQIASAVTVGLIAPRQPTEGCPVRRNCFLVQLILLVHRRRRSGPLFEVVTRPINSLTYLFWAGGNLHAGKPKGTKYGLRVEFERTLKRCKRPVTTVLN
jgi:hypothetical protein